MESRDFLMRGSFKHFPVRFVLTETTDTVRKGIIYHDTDPVSSFLFGQALTSAVLISPLLNGPEGYTLRWDYDGLIKGIIVHANANNEVRGIPKNPSIMSDLEEETQIYGEKGTISLMKSSGATILSSGTCEAALQNISDDVGYYFSYSDQIETEVCAALSFQPDPADPVVVAAGFMLQALPDCDLEQFDEMRRMLKTDEFIQLLVSKDAPSEQKLRKIINFLIQSCTFMDKSENAHDAASYAYGPSPDYVCRCNEEKIRNAVMTLPEDERKELREKGEVLHVRCEYCRKQYDITDY